MCHEVEPDTCSYFLEPAGFSRTETLHSRHQLFLEASVLCCSTYLPHLSPGHEGRNKQKKEGCQMKIDANRGTETLDYRVM